MFTVLAFFIEYIEKQKERKAGNAEKA